MAEITRITIKESERGKLLCVWTDDGDTTYTPMGPAVDAVLEAWAAGQVADDEFMAAIDEAVNNGVQKVAETVNKKLERINRNLSTDGIHVYYDGDTFEKVKLDLELEKHLIKLLKERDTVEGMKDFMSWSAFATNLYGNVTPYIREQFVSWMAAQEWLSFTEDGCIVGYRGGQKNRETGVAESIHCGPAIVDGEHVNGHVPNPDGGIIEMPRANVVDDRSRGCESGLHVGTFDYARGWANDVIMRVKVDPRDVVSVPLDCSESKIRCCRFEVLDHVDFDDPFFEDKLKAWGIEWTYPAPRCLGPSRGMNDPEVNALRVNFDAAYDDFANTGDPDWDMFFDDDVYKDYCHELVDEGECYLPEYSEWCADRFEDLLSEYFGGYMNSVEMDAFKRLFSDEYVADEDEPESIEWEDLDGEDPKDFDDVVDVLDTANDVATGLGAFGNIKTPGSAPVAPSAPPTGRIDTYRFV